MEKSKCIRTTIILPEETFKKLKQRCLNENISMSKSFRWYLNILEKDKRSTRDILGVKEENPVI